MKKNFKNRVDVVYSTNPDFNYQHQENEEFETLPPANQQLKVWLEKNGRGGKTVSIIKGFIGSKDDLDILAKLVKSKCGVGGSVKDGDILIQGDCREKILQILIKEGYNVKKAGG